MSIEGQAVQNLLNVRRSKHDLLKQAEEGWCDSRGTLEDVKTKIQMRQEGAFKRERAMAYSLAHKTGLGQLLWHVACKERSTNINTSLYVDLCVNDKKDKKRRLVGGLECNEKRVNGVVLEKAAQLGKLGLDLVG
ncbi:hypothetical protein JHK86_049804 [Glycine max]|nr:hypothetical protein JHK86_049804 [Glycine max]